MQQTVLIESLIPYLGDYVGGDIGSEEGKRTMIKSIEVKGWPEIEKCIAALPADQRQKYEELREQYEKAVEKADYERIRVLMSEANRILSPLL